MRVGQSQGLEKALLYENSYNENYWLPSEIYAFVEKLKIWLVLIRSIKF